MPIPHSNEVSFHLIDRVKLSGAIVSIAKGPKIGRKLSIMGNSREIKPSETKALEVRIGHQPQSRRAYRPHNSADRSREGG
jgi:hypothetical protein